MRIVVTGSTGLIGSRLVSFLSCRDDQVLGLVRSKMGGACDQVYWDPYAEFIESDRIEGVNAVVHLSGENIPGRWTHGKKVKIRESRVQTTNYLCRVIAGMDPLPEVLVCASAIGYYGDRGDEMLVEDSAPGEGFLSEVCQAWERATETASREGVRVVNLRIGVVLSPEGGALRPMLLPFKSGVGGVIGNGKQYWSWIALDDLIGAIYHAITSDSLRGAVNAVAPKAVTNREFTKVLGKVLSRPTLFPLPACVVRMAFGEMADDLLLASTRVEPSRLLSTGYKFRFPELENALRYLLDRPG